MKTIKLEKISMLRGRFAGAKQLKMKNGLAAFRFLKRIKKYEEAIDTFDELRNELVKETGKEEIKPDDPEYAVISRKLFEAGKEEIDLDEPLFKITDIEGNPTAEQLELVYELGILSDEE